MEDGLLKLSGAQEPAPDKYTSLATIKFLGGLQTQRSAFASIDTRYNSKFLGGKPDALIAGSNVEISNSLTLQRRPGLIPYGVSNIPAPVFFFDWELATTNDIVLVIDTETPGGDNVAGPYGAVFNYSPTNSGIYVNKSAQSQQTNFLDVVNTLYMGDGVDLYKIVGPNLLTWSNTFGTGAGTSFSIQSPWTDANVFSLTGGQADPLGGTAATQIVWGSTGSGAFIQQIVTPNYTPVASNTFTFSAWMIETGGAETVTLEIADQSGSIATQVCVLTSSWVKYQVTGTMGAGSTEIKVLLTSPTTTNAMSIYGLQLEVGGPATTTQITTTKPQGVYLWGIQAPLVAPTFTSQDAVGNTGLPWQPNTAYNVGDTIVDSNGNLEYATNDGIYPQTSFAVSAAGSGNGVYTFTTTQSAAANNALAGAWAVITGFTNAANNVTVSLTASTSANFTTTNTATISEVHAATATFGVPGTPAGTSNSVEPIWNTQQAEFTSEQVSVVQSINTPTPTASTSASVTFQNNVQNGNTLVVCIYSSHPQVISVTDTAGDTFTSGLSLGHGGTNPGSSGETRNNAVSNGQFSAYFYYVIHAAGGPTTINVTGGGNTGTYVVAAEIAGITGADGSNFNSNTASGNASGSFTTGVIVTANAKDLIFTFGGFEGSPAIGSSSNIGNPPPLYTTILASGSTTIASSSALVNFTLAFINTTTAGSYNPSWTISTPSTQTRNLGISGSFKTNVGTLQWYNLGENGAGLTATIGYQWYFAYGNSYTGHFSNVSPISVSSGPIIGQDVFVTGATRPMNNPGAGPFTAAQWSQLNTSTNLWATDPQSDLVAVYRNTDGGGFFYQTGLFGNGQAAQTALLAAGFPGLTTTGVTYSGNTWTYEDTVPDTSLNTEIYAPIGLLNSLPPAGLKNLEYFENRMWGSVDNILYFNTGPDNASLLSVQQNGVPSESWIAINNEPFNSFVTRSIAVGGGLLVFTRLDTWLTVGQNLLNGGFNSSKQLAGHGLRSYNAASFDGSSVYLYTSDRQFLCISPNSGSVEFGFPIGDFLEEDFSPLNAYIVRHVSGSRDNAVFLADGSSSWFRLNPNQQGASMGGEQTPVWSPLANFEPTIGGIGAIASIETSAGITQFLVGQTPTGTTSVADITAVSWNGSLVTYTATNTFTIGQIVSISGITTLGGIFNLTGPIQSASGTQFTLLLSAIPTYADSLYNENPNQTISSGSTITIDVVAGVNGISVGEMAFVAVITQAGDGFNETGVSAIADTNGNTWHDLVSTGVINSAGASKNWSVYYAPMTTAVAPNATLPVTLTCISTGGSITVRTVQFYSIGAIGAFVSSRERDAVHNGGLLSSFSSQLTGVTTPPNNSTGVYVSTAGTESAITLPVNWSLAVPSTGQTGYDIAAAFKNNISPATVSDTWTQSSVAGWAATCALFQPFTGLSLTAVSGTAIAGQAPGLPVLVRDLDTFSDVGTAYSWSATIGSILLATSGKIAEAESITTEMNNTSASQCGVGVLLDEIDGNFESLPLSVNDPPQLNPSVSVLSNRFYLSQGSTPPMCRHIQMQFSGGTTITKDEILAVTIRGALEAEQQ